MGGANGPVMSLISFTTDRGEDEILLGGSFSSTLGLTDRKTVECPLLRYNPSSDDWSSIGNFSFLFIYYYYFLHSLLFFPR